MRFVFQLAVLLSMMAIRGAPKQYCAGISAHSAASPARGRMDGTVPYLSRTSGHTLRSQYGLVRVRLELRGLRDLRKLFPVLNKRSGNGDCVPGVAT